jgi:hypothetical protein
VPVSRHEDLHATLTVLSVYSILWNYASKPTTVTQQKSWWLNPRCLQSCQAESIHLAFPVSDHCPCSVHITDPRWHTIIFPKAYSKASLPHNSLLSLPSSIFHSVLTIPKSMQKLHCFCHAKRKPLLTPVPIIVNSLLSSPNSETCLIFL